MTEFVALPAIVVIAYFAGLMVKTFATSEMADKLIPVICGGVGGILGVIIFITNPEFICADNWAVALAIGIVSGLAATGCNQIYKQLTKT